MSEKSRQMGEAWGWRGILGHISASLPGKVEQHLYQMAPEGVGFLHATLGGIDDPSDDKEVERALFKVDEAAKQLAEGGADFIFLGGDPLILIKGYGWDKELIKRLERVTSLPSTTSATCTMDAFRALSVKKLVIAMPPAEEEMHRRKKKFLEDNGFQVLNIKGLGLRRNAEVRKLPMYVPYQLAKEAYLESPEADGIYLDCPLWGGPAVVEFLERDLGKPGVTGHQAFICTCLKALNIRGSVRGYGRLLEMS